MKSLSSFGFIESYFRARTNYSISEIMVKIISPSHGWLVTLLLSLWKSPAMHSFILYKFSKYYNNLFQEKKPDSHFHFKNLHSDFYLRINNVLHIVLFGLLISRKFSWNRFHEKFCEIDFTKKNLPMAINREMKLKLSDNSDLREQWMSRSLDNICWLRIE